MNDNQGWIPQLPLSGRMVGVIALLAAIAVAFFILGFVSFRRAPHETIAQEYPHHEHAASFDYTVTMSPSTLYPDGLVGPIQPSRIEQLSGSGVSGTEAGEQSPELMTPATEVPPIYLKLARTMDLGVRYKLETALPSSDVGGIYSADLEVKAGDDGWTKTEELVPPTEFSGAEASFRVPVDFAALAAEIATVEEETGFNPGEYTINVIPRIDVVGEIDAQPFDETYAPAFTMTLDSVQITPDSELRRVDARTISETLTVAKQVSFTGVTLPVTTARLTSVAGVFLSLTAIAILLYLALRRLQQDEHRMIQIRHGSMLIDVSDSESVEDFLERVRLTSMRDLTRLAQRDGQIIFHQDRGPEGHRYFVPDGTVVYEYCVSNGVANGSSNGAAVAANGAQRMHVEPSPRGATGDHTEEARLRRINSPGSSWKDH